MPPPPHSPEEGPGLIEPEQPAPTVDLESLDTDRILRDTGSLRIPLADDEETSSHDSPNTGSAEDGKTEDSPESNGMEEVSPQNPRSGLNILAVISLVLALALSPFAMVFGYLAVGQIRRAHQRGEALAWVAVGLGWLWVVGWVVLGVTVGITWLQL